MQEKVNQEPFIEKKSHSEDDSFKVTEEE